MYRHYGDLKDISLLKLSLDLYNCQRCCHNFEFWEDTEYDILLNSFKLVDDEIKEMREILLEIGAVSHKSKKLFDWYNKNKREFDV